MMSAQLPQGYRFWWNYDGSIFKKEKLEKNILGFVLFRDRNKRP